MNIKENSYVLKDKEKAEFSRLSFQHQVWLEETAGVCKRAGFGPGQTLLDLGCGPGFLSFDLSRLVGQEGRVVAVDNSETFISYLRMKTEHEEYRNIDPQLVDAKNLKLPPASVDGAIARWLLMFVDNPGDVIQGAANALKPNGIFAAMEYFQFRSMSLWPRNESFQKVYYAVYELIKSYGGDPDVGGRMPELLYKNGFKVLDLYPVFRIGRPGSQLWSWLEMTGKNHDNVVEAGLIAPEELQQHYRDWENISKNPNAFFTAPPILVTIAKKL